MATSPDIYDAIEEKYRFSIPAEYRQIVDDGFLDLRRPGMEFDPDSEPTYLWIPEAEWLSPQEILAYEPQSFHKPGYVPFAFTGGGDHWCWWPSQDREAVVLCPHDDMMGRFDAPSFHGSIYRRCLDYALGGIMDDEKEVARRYFVYWAERLSDRFPSLWIEALQSLSRAEFAEWDEDGYSGQGYLTLRQYNALVARDLGFPRIDEVFEWMEPAD